MHVILVFLFLFSLSQVGCCTLRLPSNQLTQFISALEHQKIMGHPVLRRNESGDVIWIGLYKEMVSKENVELCGELPELQELTLACRPPALGELDHDVFQALNRLHHLKKLELYGVTPFLTLWDCKAISQLPIDELVINYITCDAEGIMLLKESHIRISGNFNGTIPVALHCGRPGTRGPLHFSTSIRPLWQPVHVILHVADHYFIWNGA